MHTSDLLTLVLKALQWPPETLRLKSQFFATVHKTLPLEPHLCL